MSLKKSTGNMYPWVTHMHSHLAGKCPHECSYCYVQAMERRFGKGRYAGTLRLDEAELSVNYGTGRTIFVEHMNDLFANQVPNEWIARILEHCCDYGGNANCFVFQTKNPGRVVEWIHQLPCRFILGTTIESTEPIGSTAPPPRERAEAMVALSRMFHVPLTSFVTIEPMLEPFHVPTMLRWLKDIKPKFVNIGADSKGHGLSEPPADKVRALITGIQALGVEIRQKRNLDRLLGK